VVRTAKGSQLTRGAHLLSSADGGAGQDSKRKPASEGHSRSVEDRAREWSEQRKKASQRGALTGCRAQSKGPVRTAKESQLARGTHLLSITERGTGQDSKGKPATDGHSHPVEQRVKWSGQ
jgi:hypothetical protein